MDQIEMWWKCSYCNTINGGLSKVCGERVVKNRNIVLDGGGCGKPQRHEEWFMPNDISSKSNLTKADDLEKATDGVDWYCHYCDSTQRNSNGDCAVCGGGKKASTKNRDTEEVKEVANKVSIAPEAYKWLLIIGSIVLAIAGLVWLFTPTYINTKFKCLVGKLVLQ